MTLQESIPLKLLLTGDVVLVDGVSEGEFLFATCVDGSERKLIPIYEFQYNDNFNRFFKEYLRNGRRSG